jgi:hypothetical protein
MQSSISWDIRESIAHSKSTNISEEQDYKCTEAILTRFTSSKMALLPTMIFLYVCEQPRSPHITPTDFYFCDAVKNIASTTKIKVIGNRKLGIEDAF